MSAEPALLPPLALAAGLACVAGAAALADCALLFALLGWTINGLNAIIIQLAVVDLLLLVTTIGPEMWFYNNRSWIFGNSACVVHQGLNVFATTLSLYLVTTVAFHAIATVNLEEKAANRKAKRSDHDEDEEIRSSRHSLVATSSDSSTPPRSMNVEYRRLTDSKILVARPTLFIWVLSASLSVPEFTLATTVHMENHIFICTLLDSNHKFYTHSLIALFNLFLPMFLLSIAFALIVVKLKALKKRCEISDELVSSLNLSLGLIIVCVMLCIPRSIVDAYSVYSASNDYNAESLVESVLRNRPSDTIAAVNLVLSGAYLAAALIRPILCITLLPGLRKRFSFNRTVTENV